MNLKGVREKDIHRIMNVEFMGMKQLIGKHQLSLNRIDKYLRDIEESKNHNELLDKVNVEQQKQSDELKALIKEMNEYHSNLISKMQGKLHSKPDFEILESFQKNINEKVINLLVQKIDRDDHKRFQMRMSKKLNHLEKEVEGIIIHLFHPYIWCFPKPKLKILCLNFNSPKFYNTQILMMI